MTGSNCIVTTVGQCEDTRIVQVVSSVRMIHEDCGYCVYCHN